MIHLILSKLAKEMEQYISSFVQQPEGLVEVGDMGAQEEAESCKIVLSLLSVEHETLTGMTSRNAASGSFSAVYAPPLNVNLNVVIASVFSSKRYRESLSYLSLAITFVQSTSFFVTNGGAKYTVELMAPSLQDQSNIWAQFGGKYYPSVVCKIRRLTFDSHDIKQIEYSIKNINSNVGT